MSIRTLIIAETNVICVDISYLIHLDALIASSSSLKWVQTINYTPVRVLVLDETKIYQLQIFLMPNLETLMIQRSKI